MMLSFLRWLCLALLVGSGAAADIPYVFNENSSGVAGYTSDQLEEISASSPELAGVPSISTPADNEVLEFPGSRDSSDSKNYRTVGEVKRAFSFRALQEKGMILLSMGRYEEALQAFNQALRRNPDYAEGWNCKGIILMQMDRCREAIRCFDRAIALRPSFAAAWNNKAEALWAMGKYREAMRACERAIELNSRYGDS